jgi:CHAT domain-containing protein
LIERNPIAYVPSASVLRLCISKRKNRRSNILIFADPEPNHPQRRLPGAREEASMLIGLFGEENARCFTGAEVNYSRVVQEIHNNTESDIIHFAAHSKFERNLEAFILLAAERVGNQEHNRITAKDLLQLSFKVDLITLSSCESGWHEVLPGDELLGFFRAAVAAGAPSIVFSLWTVSDEHTLNLMFSFHFSFG